MERIHIRSSTVNFTNSHYQTDDKLKSFTFTKKSIYDSHYQHR